MLNHKLKVKRKLFCLNCGKGGVGPFCCWKCFLEWKKYSYVE